MSVIVIGAGGFLGTHLVTHFRDRGEEVRPLSYRPDRHLAFLDGFTEALKTALPTAVIVAGASQNGLDDPASLTELALSNTILPAALAALLRDHAPGCCLLTYGTSWQTGESGAVEPFNAYAASKTAGEVFLQHFALAGVKTGTLRLFDTYGPGDRRNKVVNLLADAINMRADLPMSLGQQVIELVHIRDVLAATDVMLARLRAEAPGRHQVFAVRSGEPVTILRVRDIMLRAAGLAAAEFLRVGVYPYRPRERFSLSADLPPTLPGWVPCVPLERGLRELLEERRSRGGQKNLRSEISGEPA